MVRIRFLPHRRSGLIVSMIVACAVLVSDRAGVLSGPLAITLALLGLIGLPTAHALSRRLALNGAIALGAVPVLWWVPWTIPGLSRVGVVLAVVLGIVAYSPIANAPMWRAVLPSVRGADAVPVAALALCAWFFFPFAVTRTAASSLAMLRGAFGNDNVAHFDMFELIRRLGVAGPMWPVAPGGSPWAYTTYPQQFHILAAFAADLWGGDRVVSLGREIALFGVGSAIVISVAFTVLIAAFASLPVLRHRVPLLIVASAGSAALLLLGSGGSSLAFGFPGYLLAIIVGLVAIVLSTRGGTTGTTILAAAGSCVIVVAHSWSLLTPVVAVAFAMVAIRLPWRSFRSTPRLFIPPLLVVTGICAGVVWAIVLVENATGSAGSAAAALGTAGSAPIPVGAYTIEGSLIVMVIVAASVRLRRHRHFRSGSVALAGAGIAALTGIAEGLVLSLVQLTQSSALGYFQYKFLTAVTITVLVLAIAMPCIWLGFRLPPRRFTKTTLISATAALTLAVLATSFLSVVSDSRDQSGGLAAGLDFRHDLDVQAGLVGPSTENLLDAARTMAARPCVTPIFLAPGIDIGQTNQWAMSLSSTWTVASGTVDDYLFAHGAQTVAQLVPTIGHLLSQSKNRCAVVSPAIYADLPGAIKNELGARLITW